MRMRLATWPFVFPVPVAPVALAAPATLVRQRSGTLPGTQTAPVRTVASPTIARIPLVKPTAVAIPRLSQHRPPTKHG